MGLAFANAVVSRLCHTFDFFDLKKTGETAYTRREPVKVCANGIGIC